MKTDNANFCHYNSWLQPWANKLRKNMTKAEACLWKYALRARRMKGYQFRRQRPVLNYIADFMSKELKLIIEVDGFTHHFFDETIQRDEKKNRDLKNAGYRVIRFSDEAVLTNMVGVIEVIEEVITEIEKTTPLTPASGGDVSPLTPASGGDDEL